MTFERVTNSAFRIPDSRFGSTKTWNPESGNGNGNGKGIRNLESGKGNGKGNGKGIRNTEYGIRNTESNINDSKLKNFTLHNLVKSKENCFSIYSC